jgi:hypothetical protein
MTGDDTVGSPGNQVKIYVDGALIGTHNYVTHDLVSALSGANMDVSIGNDFGAHPFLGSIDDAQIYQGVLSAAQVLRLFQTGFINEVPEPASIALWGVLGIGVGAALVWRRRSRS